MAITLTVKGDTKKLVARLQATAKKAIIPATIAALNATATEARRESFRQSATRLQLPARKLSKRFRQDGSVAKDRAYLLRATRSRLEARIEVNLRGIQVHNIATSRTPTSARKYRGKGVKAAGGRLYKGAFIARVPRAGANIALKRRKKDRKPTFIPRLGVRVELKRSFSRNTTGARGRARYRKALRAQVRKRLRRVR